MILFQETKHLVTSPEGTPSVVTFGAPKDGQIASVIIKSTSQEKIDDVEIEVKVCEETVPSSTPSVKPTPSTTAGPPAG